MNYTQRSIAPRDLRELLETDLDPFVITDVHRATLASRFRAISTAQRLRVDAWMVERRGASGGSFAWSPLTARRSIGNAALRRCAAGGDITGAIHDIINDHLHRVARGYARPGSLSHWLANVPAAVQALVASDALTWATVSLETLDSFGASYAVATSDAYYDVAGARVSLRGRRDATMATPGGRLVVRLRTGAPSATALAGLRADLAVDALANLGGVAAQRLIGVWPEAGIALAVDGTEEAVRSGARDLMRAAITQHRASLAVAA